MFPFIRQWALHRLAECPLPRGAFLGNTVLLAPPQAFQAPFLSLALTTI